MIAHLTSFRWGLQTMNGSINLISNTKKKKKGKIREEKEKVEFGQHRHRRRRRFK